MSWDSYYKRNKSVIFKKFYKSVEVQKNIYKGPFKKQTHNNNNIAVKLWHSMVTLQTVFHRCSPSILSLITSESRYEIIGSIHDNRGHSLIIRLI